MYVGMCALSRSAHRISRRQKPGLSCPACQLLAQPRSHRQSGSPKARRLCISRCTPTPYPQTYPNRFLPSQVAVLLRCPISDPVTMAGAWHAAAVPRSFAPQPPAKKSAKAPAHLFISTEAQLCLRSSTATTFTTPTECMFPPFSYSHAVIAICVSRFDCLRQT